MVSSRLLVLLPLALGGDGVGTLAFSPAATAHHRRAGPMGPSSSARSSRTRIHYHPAVEGWDEKYAECGGDRSSSSSGGGGGGGPRSISTEFEVRAATEEELADLDVSHWPSWTTGDKEKWSVGNLVEDKEMPYGELSYMIAGRLEIVPKERGARPWR